MGKKVLRHSILINTGILVLVLAIAAAAIGVSYSLWSDNLSINNVVRTGTVSDELRDASYHINGDGGAIYASASGNTLTVNIGRPINANSYSYDAGFNVCNTGTLPLKIQDISVSGLSPEVTADISEVFKNDQIEPGSYKFGKVSGIVGNEITNSTFFVTITVVQWNQ